MDVTRVSEPFRAIHGQGGRGFRRPGADVDSAQRAGRVSARRVPRCADSAGICRSETGSARVRQPHGGARRLRGCHSRAHSAGSDRHRAQHDGLCAGARMESARPAHLQHSRRLLQPWTHRSVCNGTLELSASAGDAGQRCSPGAARVHRFLRRQLLFASSHPLSGTRTMDRRLRISRSRRDGHSTGEREARRTKCQRPRGRGPPKRQRGAPAYRCAARPSGHAAWRASTEWIESSSPTHSAIRIGISRMNGTG